MLMWPFNWFCRFRWFRSTLGGTWYLNRYWWDSGRSCTFWWERHKYEEIGGPVTTLRKERYT